jgi:phosphonopyruvate decarboxylase
LTGVINVAMADYTYINATNEGDAVAIAVGAALAGKRPVVLMQNSGLGNAVSPITSLTHPFAVPVLTVISWRGQPGIQDEPQHELMGAITPDMTRLMGMETIIFSASDLATQLDAIDAALGRGQSVAWVIPKGEIEPVKTPGRSQPMPHTGPIHSQSASRVVVGTRTEALQTIVAAQPPHSAVLATTGKTGRELFTLGDRDNQVYQVGSMGCVPSLGLGLALAKLTCPVMVIDGDGAALMRLGSWASVGYYKPKRFMHIVLDNGVHDSTGGQDTVAASVDFVACARATGYPVSRTVASLDELANQIQQWSAEPQLTLLHVPIAPGSPATLGRPTCTPAAVAARFKQYLGGVA